MGVSCGEGRGIGLNSLGVFQVQDIGQLGGVGPFPGSPSIWGGQLSVFRQVAVCISKYVCVWL